MVFCLVLGHLLSPDGWLNSRPQANGAMKTVHAENPIKKNVCRLPCPSASPPCEEAGIKARKKKRNADIILFLEGMSGGGESVFLSRKNGWVDLIADLKASVIKNHNYS